MIKLKRIFYIFILMMFFIFSFTYFRSSEIEASTESVALDHTEATYANNLRYGYNVTAGIPLSQGLLTGNPILKPIDETLASKIMKFNQTSQIAESYRASNLTSVAQESSSLLSAGIDSKIKFVNLGAETNFSNNHNLETVYEEQYEVFYEKIIRFYIQIESSVDLKNYLTDQFKKDLYNVSNEQEAKILLEKYGTHYFTGYDFGGIMQITNYQATSSSSVSLSSGMELKTKISATAMNMGASTDFSFSENYTQKENSANSFSSYKCLAYGGNAVSGMTIDHLFTYNSSMIDGKGSYEYGRWVTSINEDKNLVVMGVPQTADNIPLWDFLDNTEKSAEIKRLLQTAYIKMCGDKYKEFQEKYPANKRVIAGEEDAINGALVLGYNLQYKNYSKYYEAETLTDELDVYRGSTISINHASNLSPADIKWKVISGKEYVSNIDSFTGTFTVSDIATYDNHIDIGLYKDNNPDDDSDDQFITSVSFTIKQTRFSGGMGTENNPYLISTESDFIQLSRSTDLWSKHYRLVSDLDFSISTDIFKSIGSDSNPFSGTFDGSHYIIKNLTFDSAQDNAKSIGLFGCTSDSAKIENLELNNINILIDNEYTKKSSKYENVGILIGSNSGNVSNCFVKNSQLANRYNQETEQVDFTMSIGGLIGKSNKGKIEKSAVINLTKFVARVVNGKASLNGSEITAEKLEKVSNIYMGGLVGYAENVNIENCYVNNINKISTVVVGKIAKSYFGGLIGNSVRLNNVNYSVVGSIEINYSLASDDNVPTKVNNIFVGNHDDSLKVSNSFGKNYSKDGTAYKSGVSEGVTLNDTINGDFCTILPDDVWYLKPTLFPSLLSQSLNTIKPISLNTEDVILEYYYGQEFKIDGLVVKGFNVDNSEEYIFSEYRYDASGYNPYDLSKEHQIKVYAGGYTSTYNVKVRKLKIHSLIIEKLNADQKFYVDDEVELSDLKIKCVLENGEIIEDIVAELLNPKDYIEYKTDLKIEANELVYGENEIKVSFGNIVGTIKIETEENVVAENGISINSNPSKVEYVVGETFSTAGLTIKVKYESGKEVIIEGYDLEVLNNVITDGLKDNKVVVLYDAQYEIEIPITLKYRVTFVNFEDVIVAQSDYNKGDAIVIPSNPMREKDAQYTYEFVKWDRVPSETCTQNETYYAVYKTTLNEYSITFKNDNGDILSQGTYKYGDSINVPSNPTKKGTSDYSYKFMGWDKTVNETCVGEDVYTAIYIKELNKYTVKFIDYDGTLLSEEEYYYGNDITIPSNPTREEDVYCTYTFKSWDKEVSPICQGNVTYKAQYNEVKKQYSVVFKNEDGSIISFANYNYGDTILVPSAPIKPSTPQYLFVFSSWGKTLSPTCTGNVEYRATYSSELRKYPITFKNYDGSILSVTEYYYGSTIDQPLVPIRENDIKNNYTFKSWDREFAVVTGAATYVATYNSTPIEYTVVFNDDSGNVILSNKYHYGEEIILPDLPSKAPTKQYTYAFIGWDKQVSYTCVGHATYGAVFSSQLNEYVVVFVDDGGNLISSAKYKYGDVVKIPVNPTKESTLEYTYTFNGWDKEVSYICQDNATYVAQFTSTPNEYKVIFKDFDGNSISSNNYKYGETINVPADPTKEGYEFVGWYLENTYENKFESGTQVTSDITIYAKCEKIEEASEEDEDCSSCGCNSSSVIPVFITIFSLTVFLIRKKKY